MSHTSAVAKFSRLAALPRVSSPVFAAGAALGLLLTPLQHANAQESAKDSAQSGRAWSLRFTSGAMISTGAQRSSFKDAQLSAVALSWRVLPSLAVTSSFSWARSRVVGVAENGKVDVFNSDIGLEAATQEWAPRSAVRVLLFAGTGAGVRTYNYRAPGVDATNHPAGYLAVGGDVGVGRVGVRIEARDYATRFTSLVDGAANETRNDLVIRAGLSLRKRRVHED